MDSHVEFRSVRGSFSQGSGRYVFSNRGNQCVANSAMYLIYQVKKHPSSIKSADMDNVLDLGDILYSQVRTCISSQHLMSVELPLEIMVQKNQYKLELMYSVVGTLNEELDVLYDGLMNGFGKSGQLLFVADDKCVALSCVEGIYYLFDSHSRNRSGLSYAEGASIQMQFGQFRDMVKHLQRLYYRVGKNDQFEITCVKITCMGRAISYSVPVMANLLSINANRVLPLMTVCGTSGRNRGNGSGSGFGVVDGILPNGTNVRQLNVNGESGEEEEGWTVCRKRRKWIGKGPVGFSTGKDGHKSSKNGRTGLKHKGAGKDSGRKEVLITCSKRPNVGGEKEKFRFRKGHRIRALQRESVVVSGDGKKTVTNAPRVVKGGCVNPKDKGVAGASALVKEKGVRGKSNRKSGESELGIGKVKPRPKSVSGKRSAEMAGNSVDERKKGLKVRKVGSGVGICGELSGAGSQEIGQNGQNCGGSKRKNDSSRGSQVGNKFRRRGQGTLLAENTEVAEGVQEVHGSVEEGTSLEVLQKQDIDKFLACTKSGPDFECEVCHQVWFRKSVKAISKKMAHKVLTTCGVVIGERKGRKHYLCGTCYNAVSKNKPPRICEKNGFKVPVRPKELKLTNSEERLIALRIPFMHVRGLPSGQQYALKGSVINVPVRMAETISMLPRYVNGEGTVSVRLKRQMHSKNTYANNNVRPLVVFKALEWLLENDTLYKAEEVMVDVHWLKTTIVMLMGDSRMTDQIEVDGHEPTGTVGGGGTEISVEMSEEDILMPVETRSLESRNVVIMDVVGGTDPDVEVDRCVETNTCALSVVNCEDTESMVQRGIEEIGDEVDEPIRIDLPVESMAQRGIEEIGDEVEDLVGAGPRVEASRDVDCVLNESVVQRGIDEIGDESNAVAVVTDIVGADKETAADDDDGFSENGEEQNAPEYETLMDESNTDQQLQVAPGEGNTPQSLTGDVNCEFFMFPCLYAGINPYPDNAMLSNIVRFELRNVDRRFAMCITNIFFKYKRYQLIYMQNAMGLAVRAVKATENYTAGGLCEAENRSNLIRCDDGYFFYKGLRNSPLYLRKCKMDVLAMIRQLGIPTFFMSLSAADLKWVDLLMSLSKLVDGKELTRAEASALNWENKTRLVQSDPVTCARYFQNRFEAFLDCIKNGKSKLLGKVTDYYYRIEFQHRGSPHAHFLVWVEGAPLYVGESSAAPVCKFIDQYISCSSDVSEEAKQYVEYQKHNHARTCRKKGKGICRFGYPIPPMRVTCILEPLTDCREEHKETFVKVKKFLDSPECQLLSFDHFLDAMNLSEEEYINVVRSTLNEAKCFLKRDPKDVRVNAYMPQFVLVWQANHDIQFVLSAYACAVYIVGYINKQNRGLSTLLAEIVRESKASNSTIKEQVKEIGKVFLNSTEIGAQEAVYILLGMPITKMSTGTVYINTQGESERLRIVMTEKQLRQKEKSDPDVFYPNILNKYAARPSALETYCLADYACTIKVVNSGKKPETEEESIEREETDEVENEHFICTDGKMKYYLRTRKLILRYYNYSCEVDPENYYRCMLLLFNPWRNEDELKSGADTYVAANQSLSLGDSEKMQLAMDRYDKFALAELLVRIEEMEHGEYGDQMAPGTQETEVVDEEAGTVDVAGLDFFNPDNYEAPEYAEDGSGGIAQHTSGGMLINSLWPLGELLKNVQKLNVKQREAYTHIMNSLSSENDETLRLFVTGGAGVGKSVLLRTVYQSAMRFFNLQPDADVDERSVLTVAPTGKAAFLVKGCTIHSGLFIRPDRGNAYEPLSHSKLNTARMEFRNLKLLLIDEISMCGAGMFQVINLRLQELKGNRDDFGGVHVICFGDLYQLAPVMDKWIFLDGGKNAASLSCNLWNEKFSMYELTEIVRQQNDTQFAECLNRIREGGLTPADEALLRTRCKEEIEESDVEETVLYTLNEHVHDHNRWVYERSSKPKVSVTAKDIILSKTNRDVAKYLLETSAENPTRTGSLATLLDIGIGLRYEVTVNLDTSDGIVNGAGGVVKHFGYQAGFAKVAIVWMQFEMVEIGQKRRLKYKHLYSDGIDASWTPMFATTRCFQLGRQHHEISRTQMPLRAATAKTVHKSQGDTMNQVSVYLKKMVFKHTYYVAFSRVRTLDQLTIYNFMPGRIEIDLRVRTEMTRLREKAVCALNYCPSYNVDSTKYVRIGSQNAQSLHSHQHMLLNDQNLLGLDILGISETKFKSTEVYQAPGSFDKCFRFDEDNGTRRSSRGLCVLLKPRVQVGRTKTFRNEGFEFIYLECVIGGSTLDTVFCYRRPNCTAANFREALSEVVKCSVGNNTVVIGDFNLDAHNPSNENRISAVEQELSLNQLVRVATTHGGTVLDHCYSNEVMTIECVWCAWSYHHSVVVTHEFHP